MGADYELPQALRNRLIKLAYTDEKITEKISDYSEELKNWDPTDEKQENPWIIYKKKVKEQEELRKKRYDAAIQATINVSKFNR